MDFIYTLGLMIVIAAIFALLAKRLGQPLLLGYVLAGLVLGPTLTGVIADPAAIMSFFAEFGLILLLFIIGLELDFTKIKSLGKMSIIIGTAQVILIGVVVWALALLLGCEMMAAVYAGLVVAFSSTLVVVKLLADKRELDTTHGGMILGILIVEDILAVVGLTLLGALVESGEAHNLLPTFTHLVELLGVPLPHAAWFSLASLLINGALFVFVAYLFSKYLLPKIFNTAANNSELLFVSSFGVALALAAIGAFFSFSLAIGAFVAGIALSSAPFSHEVLGKAKPVKEFFLILFFVSLGTMLTFGNFVHQLKLIALLLIGAVLLKPILIFIVRKSFRYNNRISFLVSVGLAQISEFSLILAMAGVAQGALAADFMTGAVIATLLSMMLTAYLIRYDEQLYQWFKPFLAPVENLFGLRPDEQHHAHEAHKPQVLVMGVNSMSAETIELVHDKKRLLVIDKDPSKLIGYKERGIHVLCADAYNQDLYDELIDFSQTETVVSVIGDPETNRHFIRAVRQFNKAASIITVATVDDAGKKLYKAGATLVVLPEVTGRKLLAQLLTEGGPAIDATGKAYYQELQKNFVYRREL